MSEPGPRRAIITQPGVPSSLVALIAATTEGFVAAALTMAGAHRPQVRCVATTPGGERAGFATFKVTLETTWE